jgi:hypothetical protein
MEILMIKFACSVSASEKTLLDAVALVEFGEITGIDVLSGKQNIPVKLTDKQQALISHMRDGHEHIDRLIVHAGEPMQIENEFTLHGFKCIRKLRL